MKRGSAAPNDSAAGERQPRTAERRRRLRRLGSREESNHFSRILGVQPLTIAAIVAFWLVWFLVWTGYGFLNLPGPRSLILPRSLVASAGAAISFAMAAVLGKFRRQQLAARSMVAIGSALVGTVLHQFITQEVWLSFFPAEAPSSSWVLYWTDLLIRFWFFAAISAIIFALSYVEDVREREEQISALQALAHDAQLRALRNQLNPHFLFNALNSVAGLMSRNRVRDAETMIENLADFLRATLALDPQKLITLAEELKLEQLYLDIEKVRFPDRLSVTFDVPEHLKEALVPSLITQPLIENSMKYAVARSTQLVELRIAAEAASPGNFILAIEDAGGDSDETQTKGANIGIANVEERLKAHFGDLASVHSASTGGGFRNVLLMPIRRQ